MIGAGGVGRTRLAVTAAGRLGDPAADPAVGGPSTTTQVHWLPLSSLRSPTAFLPAMGVALGLRDADQHGLGAIVSRLSQSRQLLVLDNAEHLLEECRAFCRAVLSMTQSVAAGDQPSATRTARRDGAGAVDAEPAVGRGAVAPELLAAPASRLFLERASLLDRDRPAPTVRLSRAEVSAEVRISRRLDGLPLALELAAARAAVMTLPELADRLDQTLGILSAPAWATSLI